MKRLAVLVGLAMLALATPTQAQIPPECTGYGAANTKPAHCAQWENWTPGSPQPGTPGTGGWQGGTPPPGQATPGTPPPTTTTQRCQPGYVLMRYGTRWRCIPRRTPGQDQATTQCQPGWVYSRRLYRCVPGYVGPGPSDQGTPGRRVCGYGKVWSDRLYRCIPFRTGGGTDGGDRGGYNCGPGERWSNSRYRCVPRRGGDDYGSSSGGSGGINIYLGGSNKKKRRGDDDYGRRGGSDDYDRGKTTTTILSSASRTMAKRCVEAGGTAGCAWWRSLAVPISGHVGDFINVKFVFQHHAQHHRRGVGYRHLIGNPASRGTIVDAQ